MCACLCVVYVYVLSLSLSSPSRSLVAPSLTLSCIPSLFCSSFLTFLSSFFLSQSVRTRVRSNVWPVFWFDEGCGSPWFPGRSRRRQTRLTREENVDSKLPRVVVPQRHHLAAAARTSRDGVAASGIAAKILRADSRSVLENERVCRWRPAVDGPWRFFLRSTLQRSSSSVSFSRLANRTPQIFFLFFSFLYCTIFTLALYRPTNDYRFRLVTIKYLEFLIDRQGYFFCFLWWKQSSSLEKESTLIYKSVLLTC